MKSRRNFTILAAAAGGLASTFIVVRKVLLSPPPQEPRREMTTEEESLVQKFKNVQGFEFRVDAFGENREDGLCTEIYDDNDSYVESGLFWQGKNTTFSRGFSDGIPIKFFNVRILEANAKSDTTTGLRWIGKELSRSIVAVAERIPAPLLADLERDRRGSLRIKLRLYPMGALLGWDIERRPGYDHKKRDIYGAAVYVAPVHSFVGGDFQEAKIYNGRPIRKGWYIDPKTGNRIETDF